MKPWLVSTKVELNKQIKESKYQPTTLTSASQIKTFDINVDDSHNSEDVVQQLFNQQPKSITAYLNSIKNLNQYTVNVDVKSVGGYDYRGGQAHQLATVTLLKNKPAAFTAMSKPVIYQSFTTRLHADGFDTAINKQDQQVNTYLKSIHGLSKYQVNLQTNTLTSRINGTYRTVSITLNRKSV